MLDKCSTAEPTSSAPWHFLSHFQHLDDAQRSLDNVSSRKESTLPVLCAQEVHLNGGGGGAVSRHPRMKKDCHTLITAYTPRNTQDPQAWHPISR